MGSNTNYAVFAAKSEQIELALRRINRWETTPLSPDKYENMGAFGSNTMTFVQWIQFILLERIRVIIAEQDAFPSESSVAVFAVRELDGDPDAEELIQRLIELDDLINGASGDSENESQYNGENAPLGSVDDLPVPPVVYQLADVLHQFEGEQLESQLQSFDIFMNMADAKGKEAISQLLFSAAERTVSSASRLRILKAAKAAALGQPIAVPYNHDEAMKKYREDFKKGY